MGLLNDIKFGEFSEFVHTYGFINDISVLYQIKAETGGALLDYE